MLPALLITLREGLEGALIVTILVAYLVRSGRGAQVRQVWIGVAAAVAASALVGTLIAIGSADLSYRAQEAFEGGAALLAVGVLTWMVFWMRTHARSIKPSLEGRTDAAIASGSAIALPLLAFTAVGREGLETALFLFAAFRSSAAPAESGGGAVLGTIAAVAIAYGIYRGGIKLDLRRFFRVTGALIIFVAAGLAASAVRAFNEAGLLMVLTGRAWDTSGVIGPTGVAGSVLRGLIGFNPRPTVLQVIVYWAYLIPVVSLFFGLHERPARRRSGPASAAIGAERT